MLPTHIMSVFYQSVLFVVGVPGNSLIILTYGKRRAMSGNDVFLIALALADIGVCLMAPAVVVHYIFYYNYLSNAYCKFRYYTNHGLIYVSRFLTIAVAVERYLAVCKPFSRRLGPRGATIVAAVCVPLGYIMTIPIAIAFRTRELPGNRTICYPDSSEAPIYYSLRVTFPIVYLSGLTVVVICYGLIFKTVRQQLVIRAKLFGDGAMSGQSTMRSVSQTVSDDCKSSHAKTAYTNASMDLESQENDDPDSVVQSTRDIHLKTSGILAESKADVTTMNRTTNHVKQETTGINDAKNGETETTPATPARFHHTSGEEKKGGLDKHVIGDQAMGKKRKAKPKSKPPSIDNITKMLLIVTVIYFLSSAPQLLTLAIPSRLMSAFKRYYPNLYNVFVFVRSMITINHIVNPFVYGFINVRFRKDCVSTLRAMKKRLCG